MSENLFKKLQFFTNLQIKVGCRIAGPWLGLVTDAGAALAVELVQLHGEAGGGAHAPRALLLLHLLGGPRGCDISHLWILPTGAALVLSMLANFISSNIFIHNLQSQAITILVSWPKKFSRI